MQSFSIFIQLASFKFHVFESGPLKTTYCLYVEIWFITFKTNFESLSSKFKVLFVFINSNFG